MKELLISKKLILFIFLASLFSVGTSAQSAFPCDSLCVESIKMDSANKNILDVVINNTSSVFLDFPTVILIYQGDTIANKSRSVQYYGQLAKTRLTHSLSTSLKTIPSNFKCTVAVLTWSSKGRDTCLLNYPCVLATSINKVEKKEFSFTIYPNPVTSTLFLGIDGITNQPINVRIYTLAGKETISENIKASGNSSSINVAQLSKGIYLIRITGERSVYTGKFVKE